MDLKYKERKVFMDQFESLDEIGLEVGEKEIMFPNGVVEKVKFSWSQGRMMYQGDIILPGSIPRYHGQVNPLGVMSTEVGSIWDNGIVPYEILNDHPMEKTILTAIDYLNSHSCIHFRKALGSDPHRVHFVLADGCSSSIGKVVDHATQEIRIAKWATVFNVVHEMCHTIGMFHEQSRADRDSYVTYYPENLSDQSNAHNFAIANQQQAYGFYDYHSIMHYPTNSFSKKGDTLVSKDKDESIGQREGLSIKDQLTIDTIYGNADNTPIGDVKLLGAQKEQDIQVPSGYIKLNVNLNEGASGFSYLCYRKATSAETPIDDIRIVYSSESFHDTEYVKVVGNPDFGFYQRQSLYISRRKNASPIRRLCVLTAMKGLADFDQVDCGYSFSAQKLGYYATHATHFLGIYKAETDPIIDIKIAVARINPEMDNVPLGYECIPVDLNKGASGRYLYLCYKRGKPGEQGISDLHISVGKDSAYNQWSFIDQDLNQGAGGEYLYLYSKKDAAKPAIKQLTVIFSMNSDVSPSTGFHKVNVDLNLKAGGKYIYLCYK